MSKQKSKADATMKQLKNGSTTDHANKKNDLVQFARLTLKPGNFYCPTGKTHGPTVRGNVRPVKNRPSSSTNPTVAIPILGSCRIFPHRSPTN